MMEHILKLLEQYDSYSDLEREKVKNNKLRAALAEILRLGQSDVIKYKEQSKELTELKNKIFLIADGALLEAIDLKEDIDFIENMRKNNET
jgi:chromosome condensin MukBEF MukE localization factor